MTKKEKNLAFDDIQKMWESFTQKYGLSETQLNQFKKYAQILKEKNEDFNLTAIVKVDEIIDYHFEDSLDVSLFVDFKNVNSICDIGSGAGFPGIPLKIMFPHLNTILIEVNSKKINFLEEIAAELSLENLEVNSLDWRTFLRKTEYPIDLFLSRASLHTDELVRMFKPACFYHDKDLIYWASTNWQPTAKEKPFLKKEEIYKVGNKERKLIFLAK